MNDLIFQGRSNCPIYMIAMVWNLSCFTIGLGIGMVFLALSTSNTTKPSVWTKFAVSKPSTNRLPSNQSVPVNATRKISEVTRLSEVSVNLNPKTICDENIYADVLIANQNSVLKRNTPAMRRQDFKPGFQKNFDYFELRLLPI